VHFNGFKETKDVEVTWRCEVCIRQNVVYFIFYLQRRKNLVLEFLSIVHDGRSILLQYLGKSF
jgi:hypothetical protein